MDQTVTSFGTGWIVWLRELVLHIRKLPIHSFAAGTAQTVCGSPFKLEYDAGAHL